MQNDALPDIAGDQRRADREALPPHPALTQHYPNSTARARFVRDLFNRTAADYDRITGVFSFGSGNWYRRQALLRAGLLPGMRVLDAATGTGLVAREAIAVTGPAGEVFGLDISEGMLAVARGSAGLALVQARAEALPFPDGSFDFVTMGYALRHAADLRALFGEFHRVLRPGGKALVLEIGRPDGPIARGALKLCLGRIVPAISRLFGGAASRQLMRYYWDTIDACVSPDTVTSALADAGFAHASCLRLHGIFRDYTASKEAGYPVTHTRSEPRRAASPVV
jgi:demethylmenaquinone methyltransferase/2-methoxy-6-polyprenyl-1,4-benzoquinol methylase